MWQTDTEHADDTQRPEVVVGEIVRPDRDQSEHESDGDYDTTEQADGMPDPALPRDCADEPENRCRGDRPGRTEHARLEPTPRPDQQAVDADKPTQGNRGDEAGEQVALGLGSDGHMASLVPNDPVLEIDDADVAISAEYQGQKRMTLTLPIINRARRVVWLVTGEEKVPALKKMLDRDRSIPAARVEQESAVVFADEAAAGTASNRRTSNAQTGI